MTFGEMSRADKRRHLRAIRCAINAVIDSFGDEDGWISWGCLAISLGSVFPISTFATTGISACARF